MGRHGYVDMDKDIWDDMDMEKHVKRDHENAHEDHKHGVRTSQ